MAIADRPQMAPGPSAIQPYLQGRGRRRIEDEIATMLLGINPTDRANMGGALPGGTGGGGGGFAGTAPGGGTSLASIAGAAAPAGLQVGSVPMGSGSFSGSDAGGPDGGYGVASPDQSMAGVGRAAANMASFGINPVGFAAGFMGAAAINPQAQTELGGLLGGKPGSVSANIADTLGGLGLGMGGPSAGDKGAPSGTADKGDGFGMGEGSKQGATGGGTKGADGGNEGPGGGGGGEAGPESLMTGGYTGDGPVDKPAGTVHKGEYVIPADVVAMLGVPFFHGIVEMERGRMNPNIQQAPVNKPPMRGMESMPYQEELPDAPSAPQMPDGKQRFTPEGPKPPEERLAMSPQMLAMLGMG